MKGQEITENFGFLVRSKFGFLLFAFHIAAKELGDNQEGRRLERESNENSGVTT